MNPTIAESISNRLPSLERCDRIQIGLGDVLLHAAGFEDRTMAAVDSIQPEPGARALLLDYRPANPKNRLEELRDALLRCGVAVEDQDILVYDRFDPGDFENRLMTRLTAVGAKRVILDISTMSKLAILLSLGVILVLNLEVILLYAEALSYGPTREEFEEAKKNNEIHRPTIQIFTGVHGVVRVGSLASVAMQGQPTAALVFMSFNDALTQVLLNTVYPSRLFLINSRPPIHSWREGATAWIHDQVRREWEEDNPLEMPPSGEGPVPKRSVSTLEYRETVSMLMDLYWKLSPTHRVLLAPAGSKLQAVGCFIAKALHPDIHVEYPSPDGFLPQYSSGVANRWIVRFGKLKELLNTISVRERQEFLELAG